MLIFTLIIEHFSICACEDGTMIHSDSFAYLQNTNVMILYVSPNRNFVDFDVGCPECVVVILLVGSHQEKKSHYELQIVYLR